MSQMKKKQQNPEKKEKKNETIERMKRGKKTRIKGQEVKKDRKITAKKEKWKNWKEKI